MKKPLSNIDLSISCAIMAALVIYTFLGVIMRYAVGKPITWGEEFQLTCMVFIVFFAAGAGFRHKSHVAIDIVVDLFPIKMQKLIEILVYLIAVAILIFLTYQSWKFTAQMFKSGRTTDILEIPFYMIYVAFPIGGVLMVCNYSVSVFNRLTGRGA
jgi:TRAP-type C4-dicarboxylate transport system permease small subunit